MRISDWSSDVCSSDLAAEFGSGRVLDTPPAESSIIGIGIGMALADLRPIVEIQFADFIHSGFDQLVSEAARIPYRSAGDFPVPMVVRTPRGGGVHGQLYHNRKGGAWGMRGVVSVTRGG